MLLYYSEYLNVLQLSPKILLDDIFKGKYGVNPDPLRQDALSFLNVIETLVAEVEVTEEVAPPVQFVLLEHLTSAVVTSRIATFYSKLLDMEVSRALLRVETVSTGASYPQGLLIACYLILLLLHN